MIKKFDDYDLEKLNEDKMMDYLSSNFQKLTSEIQKTNKKLDKVVDEINNIHSKIDNLIKINNLKI